MYLYLYYVIPSASLKQPQKLGLVPSYSYATLLNIFSSDIAFFKFEYFARVSELVLFPEQHLHDPLGGTKRNIRIMEEPQGDQAYCDAFRKCQLLFSQVFLEQEPGVAAFSATESVADDKLTIDSLPSNLVRMAESSAPTDKGDICYGICMGMIFLADSNPTYVDAFLKAYFKAVELSLDQRVNSTTQTLAFQIIMNMAETAHTGYRSNDVFRVPNVFRPGRDNLLDSSKTDFTNEDVEQHFDQVLKVSRQQIREGNDFIVRAAMFARFTILAKETSPEWLGTYGVHDYGIEVALRKETCEEGWISVHLIATLIRLRGYAKSLFEEFSKYEKTQGNMEKWQGLLKRWIYDPELNTTKDALVQYHVIVSGPSRSIESL